MGNKTINKIVRGEVSGDGSNLCWLNTPTPLDYKALLITSIFLTVLTINHFWLPLTILTDYKRLLTILLTIFIDNKPLLSSPFPTPSSLTSAAHYPSPSSPTTNLCWLPLTFHTDHKPLLTTHRLPHWLQISPDYLSPSSLTTNLCWLPLTIFTDYRPLLTTPCSLTTPHLSHWPQTSADYPSPSSRTINLCWLSLTFLTDHKPLLTTTHHIIFTDYKLLLTTPHLPHWL